MRALSIGASTVLISVWPVLKSLPEMARPLRRGEVAQRRHVDGEVGRAVAERHALEQRGVGVEHRRGDRRVVGVDRRLEGVEVGVGRPRLDVDLRRRRPDHHDPVDLLLLAEAVDVLADRLQHRPLADAALGVVGVDVLDVRAVERGRHRPDVAQGVGDLLDVLAGVEHAGPLGGDVGVVGERVPRPEHDVVEPGDRREVLDHRVAVVGALAEADRVHQGQRADRLGEAALHQLDAGDQRGGDRAEPDGEDAEAPVGRAHGRGGRCRHARQATRSTARRPRAYSRPGVGDHDGRQRAARRVARQAARCASRLPARRRCAWPRCSSVTIRRASATSAASSARRPRSACSRATSTSRPPRRQGQVEAGVAELAADPDVHGILVQLPLPAGLDPDAVIDLIPPEKDVDGLTERSMGRLVRGVPGLVGCTPLGVMRLLERYGVPIAGRRAVVVGRSQLVGLPLALLLARKGVDATVTMAHSRTPDLAAVCREADILVAAAGQAHMITGDHVKPGAAVHRRRAVADHRGCRRRRRPGRRGPDRRLADPQSRGDGTDDDRLPDGEHGHRGRAPGSRRVTVAPRRVLQRADR